MGIVNNYTLTTSDLAVGYKERSDQLQVLQKINISLKEGELTCLMGQNGIGKSTLLRTLSGVQPPLNGEVKIGSDNISSLSRSEKAKRISLVLTERISSGILTVEEVVSMGRYPYVGLGVHLSKQDLEKINEAVDLVDIRKIMTKPLYKLSDGQLQKVLIARALAQDGDIIILDEPTAHLDLNNRVAIIRLLKSLATTTNKTILMATHELDLALQVADALLLINQEGRVIEGIPEDLILNGTLDEVFDLKGFDLKTGKYHHEKGVEGDLSLIADGYVYLWTKNALERVGYNIVDQAKVNIKLDYKRDRLYWQIISDVKTVEVSSIYELVEYLKSQ